MSLTMPTPFSAVFGDIFGIRVIPTEHAVLRIADGFEIVKNPKRRRGRYTVRRRWRFDPAVMKTPGALLMHPTLYEKLKNHPDFKVPQ